MQPRDASGAAVHRSLRRSRRSRSGQEETPASGAAIALEPYRIPQCGNLLPLVNHPRFRPVQRKSGIKLGNAPVAEAAGRIGKAEL